MYVANSWTKTLYKICYYLSKMVGHKVKETKTKRLQHSVWNVYTVSVLLEKYENHNTPSPDFPSCKKKQNFFISYFINFLCSLSPKSFMKKIKNNKFTFNFTLLHPRDVLVKYLWQWANKLGKKLLKDAFQRMHTFYKLSTNLLHNHLKNNDWSNTCSGWRIRP